MFSGEKTKAKVPEDYHHEMNQAHFKEIFAQFSRAIPKEWGPCLLLTDNAPSHNEFVKGTKIPSTATKKAEIQAWLESHSIPYPPEKKGTKAVLLELVRRHKRKFPPVYVIDKMAREYCHSGEDEAVGHEVVRLSVASPQFAAVELIWAHLKREVGGHNIQQNTT